MNNKIIERFNSKWQYTPGCWLWTAPKLSTGYGQIKANRKQLRAHRLSYELNVGPIPDGLHVLHKCDVRACVNPDHLFVGTNADNVADKHEKGRGRWQAGEEHWKAKLTAAQVIQIRASKLTARQAAEVYGTSIWTINSVRQRKSWTKI